MVASSPLLQIAPIGGELRHAFAEGMRLERLGVLDYARTIRIPDGDFKGDTYEPSRHPAQLCLLQAVEDGATWIAVAKPVQDGGSLATLVPIMRRVVQQHQIVMVAYPTQDKAKDAWTTKTWPMMQAQGGMEPKSGGGSRGGAARVVTLPGGGQFLQRSAGGRGESGQAGDTADALLLEEVDDWPDMRRLRLIERRISKSPDPLLLYVSTVKRDGTGAAGSLILRLVALGSGTTVQYPCPHCGFVQRFEWERVDVEREVIRCASCPGEITESQRQQALKKWTRHDARRTPLFSITWTALDSPFPIVVNGTKLPVLPGLCAEFKQARDAVAIGDHGLMRQFERDRLTRGYTGDEQVESERLQPHDNRSLAERSRLTTWSPATVDRDEAGLFSRTIAQLNPKCIRVVSAIDVQRNRVYWCLIGFDDEGRTYDIAWGTEYARAGSEKEQPPPYSPGDLPVLLNRVADKVAELSEGLPLTGVVDVSDGHTVDEVEQFLRSRRDWFAIQGTKTDSGELPKVRHEATAHVEHRSHLVAWDFKWRTGLGCYIIRTNLAQQLVASAYLIAPDKPGAALLPGPLKPGDAYMMHLTGTTWVKARNGGDLVWKKIRERNDFLDTRTYATVVGLIRPVIPPAPQRMTLPILSDAMFGGL